VKEELAEKPEQVNTAPHESWMVTVKLSNPAEMDSLLDATQYAELAK
jgi:glycine cleavage system H protein